MRQTFISVMKELEISSRDRNVFGLTVPLLPTVVKERVAQQSSSPPWRAGSRDRESQGPGPTFKGQSLVTHFLQEPTS